MLYSVCLFFLDTFQHKHASFLYTFCLSLFHKISSNYTPQLTLHSQHSHHYHRMMNQCCEGQTNRLYHGIYTGCDVFKIQQFVFTEIRPGSTGAQSGQRPTLALRQITTDCKVGAMFNSAPDFEGDHAFCLLGIKNRLVIQKYLNKQFECKKM